MYLCFDEDKKDVCEKGFFDRELNVKVDDDDDALNLHLFCFGKPDEDGINSGVVFVAGWCCFKSLL